MRFLVAGEWDDLQTFFPSHQPQCQPSLIPACFDSFAHHKEPQ